MKKMTRKQFAARLLNYHGGGGTPTYALGSTLFADAPVTLDMVYACREEMYRDGQRLGGWVGCACSIWAKEMSRWIESGKPLWES